MQVHLTLGSKFGPASQNWARYYLASVETPYELSPCFRVLSYIPSVTVDVDRIDSKYEYLRPADVRAMQKSFANIERKSADYISAFFLSRAEKTLSPVFAALSTQ